MKILFTDLDAINFVRTLNERNFMVSMKRNFNYFPSHQHNNLVVLDLACEKAEQLMEKVNIFKKNCQWKLFSTITDVLSCKC